MDLEEIYRKADNTEIKGTTVNERLYLSGLMDVYDNAIKTNKLKAREIFKALKVDEYSINKIIGNEI